MTISKIVEYLLKLLHAYLLLFKSVELLESTRSRDVALFLRSLAGVSDRFSTSVLLFEADNLFLDALFGVVGFSLTLG